MDRDVFVFLIVIGIFAGAWVFAKVSIPEPLPVFCTACGCPTRRGWVLGRAQFDPHEGWGRRIDQRALVCSSKKDSDIGWSVWPHTYIELEETRTVRVESACAQKGEPNG